jgi:hypothetical protein
MDKKSENTLYKVSQEERSIFREVIVSVIPSKKCICTSVLLRTVSNAVIYRSSDKVGTVYPVQHIFENSTVNINALWNSCEDSLQYTAYQHFRHFRSWTAFLTTLLEWHYQQSQRPTDASHRFTWGREGQYWAPNPNYCKEKLLYRGNLSEYDTGACTLSCLEWLMLWPPRMFTSPPGTPCKYTHHSAYSVLILILGKYFDIYNIAILCKTVTWQNY